MVKIFEFENELEYHASSNTHILIPVYNTVTWLEIANSAYLEFYENEKEMILDLITEIQKSIAGLEKIKEILETEKELKEVREDSAALLHIEYRGWDIKMESQYRHKFAEIFGVNSTNEIYEMEPLKVIEKLIAWQRKELEKLENMV